MANVQLIKINSEVLAPATAEASEYLLTLKNGAWLNCDIKQTRNWRFHKKFFSLLKFGYEYWTPAGGAVTPEESWIINEFINFISETAGRENSEALSGVVDIFLDGVANKRSRDIALLKSFDAFREWVTIQAGYYTEHYYPDGSRGRRAKSVSFAKMDDMEFHQLYKSVLNVLWNYILFRKFKNYQAAENAVSQLLEYAA